MFSIKFSFNEEVRRVQLAKENNVCVSFAELSQTVRNIFPDLKNKAISLLWKDDENDLVTVSSDQELVESIRVMETSGPSKVLRFIVRIEEGKDFHVPRSVQEVPVVSVSTVVHNGVRCDECNMVPIKGIRYKCAVREDFDMCEACEAKKTQPYPVIKICDPQHAPAAIVYAFKDQNGKEVSSITPSPKALPAQEGGFWRPQHLAQRLGFGHPPGHGHGGRTGWGHHHGPPGPPFNPAGPPPPGFQGPPPPGPPRHHHGPPPHGHPHDHPHHHPGRGFGGRGPPGAGRGGMWWAQQEPQAAIPLPNNSSTSNPRLDRKIEKYERKIEKIESRMAQVKSSAQQPVLPVASASFIDGMDRETSSTAASVASYASVSMPISEVQRVMDEEQELQEAIRASFEDQQGEQSYEYESDDEEVEDVDMDLIPSQSQQQTVSAPETPAEETLQNSNAYSTLSNSMSSINTSNASIAFGVNSSSASVVSTSGVSASALPPKYEMRFVRDVTFPNGTLVQPGAVFQKIWKVRNDGLYAWPEGVTLAFCGGDELCDVAVHEMVPELDVGTESDISMTLQAPESTGRYVAYFRMETKDESKFGQRLYANIQVSDEESDWHIVKVALPTDEQQTKEATEKDSVTGLENNAPQEEIVDVDADLAVKTTPVDEKDAHCDIFYALHSPKRQQQPSDAAFPALNGEDHPEDEVNDSLEASMTLPSSRQASRDLTLSAFEESEFAAEMALIDSATEALDIETASASTAASAPVETYQSTVAVLWSRELQLLGDMGFSDLEVLIPLLQTHVGTPASLSGVQDAAPQVEGMQRVVATLLGSFGIMA